MSENPFPGPIDPVVALLGNVELFRGLPEEDVRRLAVLGRRQRAAAGQTLVEAGGPATHCFVVGDGAVEVSEAGAPPRVLGRGEVFGQEALIAGGVATCTARVRDAAEVVAIPGEDVRRLLLPDSLATRILRLAGQRQQDPASASQAPPAGADDTTAVSRRIQRGMVPRNAPRLEGYDIAAGTTAEEHGRGNTVWDAVQLADDRTALVVMDVRSDGLPPAHLLGMTRAALRAAAPDASGPGELLARANASLATVMADTTNQFVECALVVPGADGVDWAAAGRIPAGVLGRGGTLEMLSAHGPPLGMLEGFRYGSEVTPLGVGDALLVLSTASAGLFRGAADLVVQVQEKTAGDVVATVHRGLRRAQGETPPEVSVLYLRKH